MWSFWNECLEIFKQTESRREAAGEPAQANNGDTHGNITATNILCDEDNSVYSQVWK